MNMIEKIERMMSNRKLSKADVSKGAEIPYTTFDGIFKKGYENMKLPTLQKLATFFNVSMEYLINDNIEDENWGKYVNAHKTSSFKKEDIESDEFTTPEAAMAFILKQPALAAYGGYDINEMTNEEIIEFANELLRQLKLLGYKYKK